MAELRRNIVTTILVASVMVFLAACAPTQVQILSGAARQQPRPDLIFVYNFAVSPGEVPLYPGLSARINEALKGPPRTPEELAVGHKASDALAGELVNEIQMLGLPAQRAAGTRNGSGNVVEICGQFVSIDEGNRAERMVIGLGADRTDVKTYTQLFDSRMGQRILMAQFETDARSSYKSAIAEAAGGGAAAGNLPTMAAGSGVTTGTSEETIATVEADAKRTAKQIAKQLGQYFVYQGWIPPGEFQNVQLEVEKTATGDQ